MSDWTKETLPEAKGKIIDVRPQVKDGQQATFVHNGTTFYKSNIKFEGIDHHFSVLTKDSEASTWKVGEEVNYIPTKSTSPEGTTVLWSAKMKQENKFGGKGFVPKGKGKNDYLAEAAVMALSAASSMVSMGGGDKTFSQLYKEAYQAAKTEITSIFG